MTTNVLLQNVDVAEIFARFDKLENALKACYVKSEPQQKQPDLLTRKDVAKLLGVSLVTVNDWTNKGILTAYKCGNRVYYKEPEVMQALTKKGGKYVSA